MVAPVSQKNFQGLATLLGPEWAKDPRVSDPALRIQHWSELMAAIENWTRHRTAAECEATLGAAGVPCSRYRTVAENLSDPNLIQRGVLAEVRDGAGTVVIPTAPFQMPGTNSRPRDQVPGLGVDTTQVLRDVAGMDEAEIAACLRP